MVCLWCGKKIALMRGIVDREFCSQVHRRLASKAPDRIAKETDVTSDYDMSELWTVEKENKRQAKTGHQAVGVFAVLGIITLAAIGLATSNQSSGSGGNSGSRLPSLNPTATSSTWGDSMRSVWRSHAQVTLTHDFSTGLGDFIGGRAGGKRDWSLDTNGLRPGKLRIWQRSTSLQDYDVDFLAQIEQKSMGWAFRAPDVKNYYGTKLTFTGHANSSGPNAGLVRFVMLDGREQERSQLPIPFTLERGVPYRVHLSVQGSRFVTTVNSQVVSSWSDSRLPRGGVGFFSEDGEVSTVRWVSLAERDSMLGRLLAHFSLIEMPWLGYYEEVEIGR
jgi:hypothetical protein